MEGPMEIDEVMVVDDDSLASIRETLPNVSTSFGCADAANNCVKSILHQNGQKTNKQTLQENFLKNLQAADSIMEPNVERNIRGFLSNGGAPEIVIDCLADSYRGFAQCCKLLGCWLIDLEGNRECFAKCVEKSLSTLIEKRFMAEVIDKNFDAAGNTDEWLTELLKHSTWRNLIYSLAEQNPRCKFLKKAIQLVSNAGFQHEITSIHIAAQQLEIYSRMVLAAIDGFFLKHEKGPLTEDYEKAFAELARVVCYSEHTYLFTQTLLHQIIREEKGQAAATCVHIAQALCQEARKRNYQDLCPIHIALKVGDCGDDIKQAMQTMLNKKCLNPVDITRLYEQYNSSEPPAVEFIQDVFFMDMLIDALFAYEGAKVHPCHRSKYIFLLSYASTGGSHGADDEVENLVEEEFSNTKRAMQCVLNSIRSKVDLQKDIFLLLDGISFPSIACGMLHYLQGFLLSESILSELELVHCVLLDDIATKHPGLHVRLFEMLLELYDRQSKLMEPAEMIIEKQRNILDRFVHLLSVGFVLPVLEKINKMFNEGQIDISLVRYFAVEILDIIEPPYSDQFIEIFLPIVSNPDVLDSSTLAKIPAAKQFMLDALNENAENDPGTEIAVQKRVPHITVSKALKELLASDNFAAMEKIS